MSAKFFAELTALRRLAEQQAADIAELRGQVVTLQKAVQEVLLTDRAGPTLPPSARKARSNGYKRT